MSEPPNSGSFASALSRASDSRAAADEVAAQALQQLDGPPQLAFLFFSADHLPQAPAVARRLVDRLGTSCLIGCGGESIAGVQTEVELEPAMSLWLAKLPDTTLLPMRLEFERTADGGSIVGWSDELIDSWPQDAALILVGDPYSFPADLLVERLNDQQPGIPVVGGMASAAHQPGENQLILGDRSFHDGAVAIWLRGGIQLRTVVSQGCRPIGGHFVITQAERNVLHQLGGLPAYRRLEEVYRTLPTSEQRLMQGGLHIGRVVSEYQDRFRQGDFLVRNVVGVDPEEGSIAITDYVRVGQTVQFHVRDAESADAELKQLLAAVKQDHGIEACGALLFTCNGRGTRLFPQPHHDAQALHRAFGSIPMAGFFAAGELGPIGGRNFLHGFTASIALFVRVSSEACPGPSA